ncbi:uncharacterized protein [Typha angustifolia]|uniref:uncharacterized protein n=1 Tax=Typha angustifolia TaxID=59011 RepID=UPI003C2F452A
MAPQTLSHFLSFLLLSFSIFSKLGTTTESTASSIAFTTLGRSRYFFDLFFLPTSQNPEEPVAETQLTDGFSVNYNGFFPSLSSSLLSSLLSSSPPSSMDALLYVSERNGSSNIYLDLFVPAKGGGSFLLPARLQFPLLRQSSHLSRVSMKDKPALAGDDLIYVSTHEPSSSPRRSWAAVYSTHLATGQTRRLTPYGVSDFSPAVSPSGNWTAVASSGARGWSGEVEELKVGIFVFRTADGSGRTLVVDHGGWPCWADESTLYFHRRSSDGWWSIYRAKISIGIGVSLVSVDRITPPGFHAFTPAVSAAAPKLIAVATRRSSSQFRHIELIEVGDGGITYVEVTRPVRPNSHHFNPFFSPDASRVGYHRCRGRSNGGSPPLLLESIKSLAPEAFSLFRIDGSFPSFSHDGKRIAFVGLPGVFVVNSDGSDGRREIFSGNAFPTAWDWKREGVIYTSHGPDFATESTNVDIISITLHDDDANSQPSIKKLTSGGKNNAFPSPSPDGKWVVFRSGRSGHKNLYIMDAVEGEAAGLQRLTDGPWSDTMCNWSPDGEWIAFASDRDNPGSGSFAIYMVHPNGTGLRKVVHSGEGGRTNHPWFSPNSKSLVFTSDYAGVSAEPISNPHHYQPYGDIFIANIDGSNIQRLTHNSYEDGTPTWTPLFLEPTDVAESLQGSARCNFDDCHWLNIKGEVTQSLHGKSC